MIHCYVDQSQKNWHEQLSLLAAAYRSARNSSTGFTPNMLMLGREVYQPQDIWLGVAERRQGGKEPLEHVQDLEKSLDEVHEMARQHLKAAQHRQKRLHDLRAQQHSYNVGDLVYVRNSTKKKGFSPKLQPPWKGLYIVTASCWPVLYEILTQRERKDMHNDRLKLYTNDVISAWIRRQRHKVLPQCQNPVTPAEQAPKEQQPMRTDHSSGQGPDETELDPPRTQGMKSKRQVAARR